MSTTEKAESRTANWRVTWARAKAAPVEDGRASALLMRHGSMSLRYYAPRGVDAQTPHDQDELYLIAQGSGMFRRADTVQPFGPGDALFVPAGIAHRFEDFSDDFATWVVFYGAQGGESEG